MKVGTDGVLLGAWVDEFSVHRILDIGTGTGLIALMLAQRFSGLIDAVEIDEEACLQARENFTASPWAGRLQVIQTSLQDYIKEERQLYDLIVSNPPFYAGAFTTSSEARNIARHSNIRLSFTDLINGVHRLLKQDGRFCLILPAPEAKGFIRLAAAASLFPQRITRIKTKKAAPDKRFLIQFRRVQATVSDDELVIRNDHS